MNASPSILALTLFVLVPLTAAVAPAQDAPAPDDAAVLALRELEDATRPITLRAQVASRLLAARNPAVLDALGSLLVARERDAELRYVIATGALAAPGLPLLDRVIEVATRDGEEAGFQGRIFAAFRWLRSPELVRELSRRAADAAVEPSRRVRCVDLLGRTGSLAAVPSLIALWREGGESIGPAAHRGLYRVLPVRFESPDAAQQFYEERTKAGEDLETILRSLLDTARSSEQTDPGIRRLVALAAAVLDQATLDSLLVQYLACLESAEVRRMGAERLRTYPFAEREKTGEAAARRRAAGALLPALEKEENLRVAEAMLKTVRTLVGAVREENPALALRIVGERMGSADQAVRLAAVAALGELQERSAIPDLLRVYEGATGDSALRLAILDALDKLGDGISDWILGHLGDAPDDETVTLRLVQLLKKYPERRDAVPALIRLLQGSRAERIRQEAAFALGILGAKAGDAEAIDALAVVGLADSDPSVRVNSASQLGGAPEVDGKIIQLLRERLKETEKVPRVRFASAWSLLKLRGMEAFPWLGPFLGDDEFWSEVFRNWLNLDVLAAGRAGEAVKFVAALGDARADARCAEAARRVLDVKDLAFEGEAAGGRLRILLRMAEALSRLGKSAEALAALNSEEQSVNREGEGGVRFDLLKGRLLRETGAPGRAVEILRPLTALPNPPAGIVPVARLELGRALLALRRLDEARAAVEPVLADRDQGAAAQDLLKAIEAAREPPPAERPDPEALVRGLDAPDEAARREAAEKLRALGEAAFPAILAWFDSRTAEQVPAAVGLVQAATGLEFGYDPSGPEAGRKAALELLRRTLSR